MVLGNCLLLPSVPCKHPECSAASAEPFVRPPCEPEEGREQPGAVFGAEGSSAQAGWAPQIRPPKSCVSTATRGWSSGCCNNTARVAKVSSAAKAACHETKPQSSPGPWPCPRQAAPEKPSSESHPCAPRATETLGADGIRRINAVSTLLCSDFRGKAVMRLISSETCRKWIWTVNNEAYCKW